MRELTSTEIGCFGGGDWQAGFNSCMSSNWGNNTIVGATTGAFVGGVAGGILGAMGGSTGTFFYCMIA